VDVLFTGNSDSDGGDADFGLQERKGNIYRNVDETQAVDKNFLRRAADMLYNIDWEGTVV